MDVPMEVRPRRRIDLVTLAMMVVTAAALGGAGWLGYSRSRGLPPPVVGSRVPPLFLLDLDTLEPYVMAGSSGQVVWIVFWSADAPSSQAFLTELAAACNKLKRHGRFTLVAAALEADEPERVRDLVARSAVALPVYLARPETRRRFGADRADPPLHILVDASGCVAAMAHAADRPSLDRLAAQVERLLDALEPQDDTRFASVQGSHR